MQKLTFALLLGAALLSATPPPASSQRATRDPDPGIAGEGYVDFVGNYGEVFKLRGGWQVTAFMRGNLEVIEHYPTYRVDVPDSMEAYEPRPEDFVPENFTKHALIQLLILPRKDSSFYSLADLRQAKIKELQDKHVGFDVIDNPRGLWPAGSFEVRISTPYRLKQLYAASDRYLCILTSGWDEPPAMLISSHLDFLRSGLEQWLESPAAHGALGSHSGLTAAEIWHAGLSAKPLTKPIAWISWIAVTGISLLGFALSAPGSGGRRVSLMILGLSHAGAFLGGIIGLSLWSFDWTGRYMMFPAAVACLFMPLAAHRLERFTGTETRSRAWIGIILWTLSSSVFLVCLSALDTIRFSNPPYVPALTVFLGFESYAVGGLIFGLLSGPAFRGNRSLAVLALIFMLPALARAQQATIPIGRTVPLQIEKPVDTETWDRLRAREIDPETTKTRARDSLQSKGAICDFHRVEIAGIRHFNLLKPSDANGIEKFTQDLNPCGWSVYNQLITSLRSSRKLAPSEVANMARQALGIPIPQPAYVPRPRRDPDRDPDPGEDCFIATDGVRMCRH